MNATVHTDIALLPLLVVSQLTEITLSDDAAKFNTCSSEVASIGSFGLELLRLGVHAATAADRIRTENCRACATMQPVAGATARM